MDVGVLDVVVGDGVGSERSDVGHGRRERQGGARRTDPVAHSNAVVEAAGGVVLDVQVVVDVGVEESVYVEVGVGKK